MTRTVATLISLALTLTGALLTSASAQSEATATQAEAQVALALPAMADIEGGTVELLFPIEGEEETRIEPFRIDLFPVTNAEFLQFVMANPTWTRSALPEVFGAPGYLAGWAGDYDLGNLDPTAPVTNVSWFAAAAYCEARGDRLPTEAEWEYVGKAGQQGPLGSQEPGFNERILTLTASRPAVPQAVGQGEPNYFGVYDMHGSVWEWVFDIGAGMATGDSRSEGDRRLQLVCGGGSAGASDKSDYAAFLRYAFRNGLEGNYSNSGLGFRCASGGGL